ncbi:MAG: flagellar export chaperone FliS [Candidatus Magnetobacterium sp. LHC-1]|uniref:Flagellar secretion chaperone FliS n=1 Tax=Candidatus Magnetobacterium casense TaxID=1455061 RepID=A0ABS6RYT2_9BACT|nr:flagellar export chaperone FliS [Candidatus Magnetobacterium casensis]MBF0608533.1 flagellar export chaperone FliS [Nitrospirota bacterium]MBV6341804.1 flagellar export chaperone FliS [Candidatus Magnetobacterium casensis]
MTNAAYAQTAYISMDISSLSPLDLIIKLYDGAISFLSKAVVAINKKDKVQKIQYLNRSRMIIEELLFSLNVEDGGEVALNLQDLYTYILLELTRVNASESIDKIYHIQELLKTLRSAWFEIKTTVPASEIARQQMAVKAH